MPVPCSLPVSHQLPDTNPHRLMVPEKVLVPWIEPDGYLKVNVTWFRLIVPNTGPVVGKPGSVSVPARQLRTA